MDNDLDLIGDDNLFNSFDNELSQIKKNELIEINTKKDVKNISKKDLCEDIILNQIPATLDEIELQINRLKQRWNEFTYLIGERLKYINDNKLYTERGYTDFKTYVNIALKMSENNAYYYIAIFEYFTEEQTIKAGSKLKLIIPILNKVKKDKEIPDDLKEAKLKDLRDELFTKIYNKTYREAEKLIDEIRKKYFPNLEEIEEFRRVIVTKDKIIINESDKDIQEQLLKLINDFYS